MINKILKALKAVDIYNISPLDFEQEDKIKDVVLSVTGLSTNDRDFDRFISKLVHKFGLYDGDPEDNTEVLAWETALKLGVIKPFKGWPKFMEKEVDYIDIEEVVDSEYFEDDYPIIRSYLNRHGVLVNDNRADEKFNQLVSIWEKLLEMGYSDGDIINSDDISEAANELGMDFDEAMDFVDELEETYDVSIMSNDMLSGDGPGSYYVIDSSAEERMEEEGYVGDDLIAFTVMQEVNVVNNKASFDDIEEAFENIYPDENFEDYLPSIQDWCHENEIEIVDEF